MIKISQNFSALDHFLFNVYVEWQEFTKAGFEFRLKKSKGIMIRRSAGGNVTIRLAYSKYTVVGVPQY
jgi:hypothetical protein